MNRTTLIGAVMAGMLAVPASYAAIDDAGMQYTSAAEGFYGSLRMEFSSKDESTEGSNDTDSTGLDASNSRLGVRGSVDLGGGMSANYQYEFGVNGDNGKEIGTTRVHTVGLDGGFGSLLVGTQWALDYNTVWGTTDVMNSRSGNLAYSDDRAGRQSNAITYNSPDFNGFNFGISAVMAEGEVELDSVSVMSNINSTVPGQVGVIEDPDTSVIEYVRPVPALGPQEINPDPQGIAMVGSNALNYFDTLAVREHGLKLANDGHSSEEASALDKVVLAASYQTHGFTIGGTYVRRDLTTAAATVYCPNVTAVELKGAFTAASGQDITYNGDGFVNADTLTCGTEEVKEVTEVLDDQSTPLVDETVQGVAAPSVKEANPAIVHYTETNTNPTSLGLALGYGQDNWSLNYWYGRTDHDVASNLEETLHSFAGQLQIDKTTLRAIYDNSTTEQDGAQDVDADYLTVSAQYDLGSKSRVWIEYSDNDTDNSGSDTDSNALGIGYRVDF